MSTNNVEVQFGATTGAMQAGCTEASNVAQVTAEKIALSFKSMQTQVASSMTTMQSTIKTGFSEMNAAMGKVGSAFMAVTAVLAGGAAFKKVVDETNAWTGQSITLARQLGVTTQEASTLMVATERLGMSTDSINSVLKGLVRNLKTNEAGLNQMGIATKDSNGKTLSMIDIMLNANKVLLGYKEGKDRDVAMMAVYGRAALENSKFVKLNAEVMEEAKRRAEELHLVVGPEGVEQFNKYRAANIDCKEVLRALAIQIGNAVIPAITQLGAWFGSTGPQLCEIFVGALKGIISFFEYVGLGAVALYEAVKAALSNIVSIAVTSAKVMMNALMGNWPGVINATVEGSNKMEATSTAALMNIAKAADATNTSLSKLWGLTPTKAANVNLGGGGSRQYNDDAKADKSKGKAAESRVPMWREELQSQLEAEKNFFKDSKAEELTYWKDKLDSEKLSAKERIEIKHTVFQLEKQMAQESLQVDIQTLKEKYDNALQGSVDRINIAKEEAAKYRETCGEQSVEYKRALRDVDKAAREHAEEQKKINLEIVAGQREIQAVALEMDREMLNYRVAIGEASAEEQYQIEKRFEDRRYALELQAAKEKLTLLKEGTVDYQKAVNNLEMVEKNHQKTMLQLNLNTAKQTDSTWQTVFSNMTNDFQLAITQMSHGTLTWSKVWKYLLNNMISSFSNMIKKVVSTHLAAETTKTSATEAGVAARTASEQAGFLAGIAAQIWASVKKIGVMAYEAAAGAYDATVSIPYVGPILAPIAAVVSFAAVSAYGAMAASAAGGYDIPAGVNPVTQLHQEEMVLPADIAKPLKGMLKGGGIGGGININFNVSAVDAKGVKTFLRNNSGAVASALAKEVRNFSKIVMNPA